MVGVLTRDPLTEAALESTGEAIGDHDVPVFALLRSTMGLPGDDLRRRWAPPNHSRPAPRHALMLVRDGVRVNADFETPTVALLERILAALRSPAPGAGGLRPVGRHELAAV